MRRAACPLFLIPLIALVIAQPATAYEYPLSSEAIRDAYFLGKASADKRRAFFAQYTRHLSMPKTGPFVAVVRVETPYAVIVQHTARMVSNYFAQDAEEEFFGKPGIFRVRVRIDLTSSYGWEIRVPSGGIRFRSDDFWRDFKIRLVQHSAIEPLSVRGQPIYSLASDGFPSILLGANVDLDYDAKMIPSGPITVVVDAPDGQHVTATFDLANLR